MNTTTIEGAAVPFPVGTRVSIYPKNGMPTGAPPGRAVASAKVAPDGTLAVTGLSPDREYLAHAVVAGAHRYLSILASGAE